MPPSIAGSSPTARNIGARTVSNPSESSGARQRIPAIERAVCPNRQKPSSNFSPSPNLLPANLSIPPMTAPTPNIHRITCSIKSVFKVSQSLFRLLFCCPMPVHALPYSPRITASISSTVRGIAAERFSQPFSVTRQLSSRRKPMPHSS